MQTITVTEFKKEVSTIINNRKTVIIKNPKNSSVILPYDQFIEMEKKAMIQEALEIIEQNKGKKRYTDEEVDQMLDAVFNSRN
ncbi:MAG: hypothetical protein HQM12_23675 [SAR324 cluster bacterium]|nr:hypothetical protein [SAR324 cluster bacterium]